VVREVESDPSRLRRLAERARRLANGAQSHLIRDRLLAAAKEYDQRAIEIEMDEATGQ
jgi:DNA-directed RNA polymerase subunit K/omega